MVDNVRLCDIGRTDRLDEVGFELPLAGGDDPTGTISMLDVADLLRSHLRSDDPVARYADRLDQPALAANLHGYLSGSIDLVLRFAGRRLAIVDYKTNRLAAPNQELSAWNYRRQALDGEMHRAHYPLQAILYMVALHRYLRSRDPQYDAGTDLAGVLYLFVRGMSSPEFPVAGGEPCGVWSWCPPAALIEDLSDLFDRGSPR
jgi:exodeoxyribonuclease V beta subunit